MSPWTKEQLAEFERLLAMIDAPGVNNMDRPIGRAKMRAFVAKHGKQLCDEMFAFIQKRDSKC